MFRLLGLLGGLSLATDLGTGAPLEESLKRCVVAARLARAADCPAAVTGDVVYTSLLQHLGCTAYSHETAEVWGDDVAFVRLAFRTDFADRQDVWRTWVGGLAAATGRPRARVVATALTAGRKGLTEGPAATCEIASNASRGLGLPASVRRNLGHVLAEWNGRGTPAVAREAIPMATRIVHVASTAVLFGLHGGPGEAVDQVRRRAGTSLDPRLADLLATRADELLGDLADLDAYQAVLDTEPDPVRLVDEDQVETVARTFGHLADLKSPWLQGHSAAVADLAARAATTLGLAGAERTLRIAGHLHDLGRVGVSSRIWDKPARLSLGERELARLHAYHGERIVSRVPELAEVATLVGQHHERCDGSGYHRGLTGAQLSLPSRLLAVADAYCTLVEERPYRAALSPTDAAHRLRDGVRRGALDGDAVAAVLATTGLRRGRASRPSGLTDRQVEVLRLVASGLSNQQIADRLVISRRTAEHHVQDVYVKIGASTRAGAALFAMEHGLLGKPG